MVKLVTRRAFQPSKIKSLPKRKTYFWKEKEPISSAGIFLSYAWIVQTHNSLSITHNVVTANDALPTFPSPVIHFLSPLHTNARMGTDQLNQSNRMNLVERWKKNRSWWDIISVHKWTSLQSFIFHPSNSLLNYFHFILLPRAHASVLPESKRTQLNLIHKRRNDKA